jgi:hypothetical protein
VLERRASSERPPRLEYVLTHKGWELCDVLLAITAWGDRWTAGDAGPRVRVPPAACGPAAHVEPHCAHCGEPMPATDANIEPGPGLLA